MSGGYSESSSSSGSNPRTILKNYGRYLPALSSLTADQIGTFVNSISKAGVTATQGSGKELGAEVSKQTNSLNPSLSTALTAANNATSGADTAINAANTGIGAAGAGINAVNLNGLSPGEAASVERSLNQSNTSSGNLGLVNPTNTITNALNFGGAFNNKLGIYDNQVKAFNDATNTATNASGAASGAANAASNVAGAKATGMLGLNSIINPAAGGTDAAMGFAGQMGQMSAGNRSQSSSTSMNGGMNCCFIFMEAYHGEMPWFVRKCRDRYYNRLPRVSRGYKRMAKVLVPLMKTNTFIRGLVWKHMILPLTEYGMFVNRLNPEHRNKKSYRNFWFTVWNILGYV